MMKEKTKDLCEVFCLNEPKVEKVKSDLLPEETLTDLSEMYKVLSDKNRVKILMALRDGELCVCDISHVLGASTSAVSHQLRILRNKKLVKYRNEGKIVFYSLSDDRMVNLLDAGLSYLQENREKQ